MWSCFRLKCRPSFAPEVPPISAGPVLHATPPRNLVWQVKERPAKTLTDEAEGFVPSIVGCVSTSGRKKEGMERRDRSKSHHMGFTHEKQHKATYYILETIYEPHGENMREWNGIKSTLYITYFNLLMLVAFFVPGASASQTTPPRPQRHQVPPVGPTSSSHSVQSGFIFPRPFMVWNSSLH